MHNVEHQPDRGSADRTTQLDLCNIKSKLPVEHGQTHHIGIPRSKPIIHITSPNEPESSINTSSSTPCVSSRSNKGQAPSRWMLITYAFQGQLPSHEPYEPQSFNEAMENINKTKWEEVMRDKYLSLIHNETWTLVTESRNRRVLQGKWAYKLKRGPNGEVARYKAQ